MRGFSSQICNIETKTSTIIREISSLHILVLQPSTTNRRIKHPPDHSPSDHFHKSAFMDDLLQSVSAAIPDSLSQHSWYIIVASALIACQPEELASLYVYLQGPKSPLPDAEKAEVSLRLQDVLNKAWTLVGIPRLVVAMAGLAKVENENGEREGLRRVEEWQPPNLDPTTTQRGISFLQALYKHDMTPTFQIFGSHTSYAEWLEKSIVYGLFLSDHRVLTPVEAELTILTSIMCQGIRRPTMWHLRGLRRLGVSEEDVNKIQDAVKKVARWAGKDEKEVEGWATARDVRDQV